MLSFKSSNQVVVVEVVGGVGGVVEGVGRAGGTSGVLSRAGSRSMGRVGSGSGSGSGRGEGVAVLLVSAVAWVSVGSTDSASGSWMAGPPS